MSPYRRPTIEDAVFRDEHGAVIAYGNRWGEEGPPPEAYSVTHDLERFRPLHAIADALIAHLHEQFDVMVSDDVAFAADLMHHRDDVVRAVRVVPSDPAAAPLTFVLTSFPSVIVHAGLLHDFLYPVCGCDACDESWEPLAQELEWQTLAVAAGGYRERVDPAGELGIAYSLTAPGIGSHSGTSRADDVPPDLLAAAIAGLPPGGRWAPWPRRDGSPS